jgi:hypothetical protein
MVLDDPAMVRGAMITVQPRLLIHVPEAMLERHGQAGFGLYRPVARDLRARGLDVAFVARPGTTELTHYTKEDFHLVHHGFLRRFNVLNSGIAYMNPYWYLDPRGVLCDSSMANARADFAGLDGARAERFAVRVRENMLAHGGSKYDQPARQGAMGQGHIAVFLQGMGDPVMRNMHMLETEMLDCVMRHRGRRRVIIKPHPKWPDTLASAYAEKLAAEHPEVTVVDGNVHDMLVDAYCSVSICSGASFEGLFQRVPAVLFGRSDFGACAWTVRNEAEAGRALRGIRSVPFEFDRFVFWFLRRKMFNAKLPNIADQVVARIEKTGFSLGLGVEAEGTGQGKARQGRPAAKDKAKRQTRR